MRLLNILLPALLVATLWACATPKTSSEPTTNRDTLVLAALSLEATGYDSPYGISISGTVSTDLRLEIRNDDDDRYFIDSDFRGGLAFSYQVPPGRYYLQSVFFSRQNTSGKWVHILQTFKKKTYFTVTASMVNIIGQIKWSESITKDRVDFNGNRATWGKIATVSSTSALEITAGETSPWRQFVARYPETAWKHITMTNVFAGPINLTLPKPEYSEIDIPGIDWSN